MRDRVANSRRYYERHRVRLNAKSQRYREAHRAELLVKGREYWAQHRDETAVRRRTANLDRSQERFIHENSKWAGLRFGRLVVVELLPHRWKRQARCRCDCGKVVVVRRCDIRTGRLKSCGCAQHAPRRQWIGLRFGRLVVVRTLPHALAQCSCDCGRTITIERSRLSSGNTRSCGCLRHEVSTERARRHGESRSKEYRAWHSMKQRCLNPKGKQWADYGGRGITVWPDWISDYLAFLAYIGRAPSPKHTLDRYPNNDGNYQPGNVRWATQKEQQNNRRPRRWGGARELLRESNSRDA